MPTYDFRCEKCGSEFSDMLPMRSAVVPMCPQCENNVSVRKVIRPPMVHFKGSGFYKTDSSKPAAKPKHTETKTDPKPAEAKPAEKKPDAPKPDAKK